MNTTEKTTDRVQQEIIAAIRNDMDFDQFEHCKLCGTLLPVGALNDCELVYALTDQVCSPCLAEHTDDRDYDEALDEEYREGLVAARMEQGRRAREYEKIVLTLRGEPEVTQS